MGMRFFNKIDKHTYTSCIVTNSDVMSYYETLLQTINQDIKLSSTLTDLLAILHYEAKFNNEINSRLKIAPSKEIALQLFEKELMAYVDCPENPVLNEDGIDTRNFDTKFRKVGYDLMTKGINPTLKELGHLVLVEVMENKNGYDEFISYSAITDYKMIIIDLVEGAAISKLLHNKSDTHQNKAINNEVESFREISDEDLSLNQYFPLSIYCVYKWCFDGNIMIDRFCKIKRHNFKCFVYYSDWYKFKEQLNASKVFGEDGDLLLEDDVDDYLKEYSDGFLIGYDDLDKEIKETTSVFTLSNDELAKRIFEVTKTSYYPFSGERKFIKHDINGQIKTLSKEMLKKTGMKMGRIYKAWFFIINNPTLFLQLFKKFHIPHYRDVEKELKESNSNIKDYRTELQDIMDEFDSEKLRDDSLDTKFTSLPKPKVKSDLHALTYLLECDLKTHIPPTRKDEIEEIGFKRGINGNTFYKALNRIRNRDRNKIAVLINIDSDWRRKVLSIAEKSDELDGYLIGKQL